MLFTSCYYRNRCTRSSPWYLVFRLGIERPRRRTWFAGGNLDVVDGDVYFALLCGRLERDADVAVRQRDVAALPLRRDGRAARPDLRRVPAQTLLHPQTAVANLVKKLHASVVRRKVWGQENGFCVLAIFGSVDVGSSPC